VLILRLAFRNVRRNLRRTIITISAIALGLAMLIVSSGFGDGAHGQMIEAGVKAMAGHVVIQGKGWQKKREVEIVVPDSPEVARRMGEALPGAKIVERVYLQGLLTSANGAVGVALSAVEPEVEARVNDIDDKLVEGEYLGDASKGIVLGKTLAKTLGVRVGHKVVFMTQRGGDIESQLLRVRGIFSLGIDEIDGFYGQIQLSTAQKLLGLGDDVTQVSAHIDTYRNTAAATRKIEAAFADTEGIEVLSWGDALPDLREWIQYDDGGLYVMILVVAIIVAMGILNTVLMSVLERMREFGVMLSLGTTPGLLMRLVLMEAAIIGVLSVTLGVAIGVGLNALLAINGIDVSSLAESGTMEAAGVALDLHMFPDLSWRKVVVFSLLSLGMTLLAAVYPAYKAAALKPIECLRSH